MGKMPKEHFIFYVIGGAFVIMSYTLSLLIGVLLERALWSLYAETNPDSLLWYLYRSAPILWIPGVLGVLATAVGSWLGRGLNWGDEVFAFARGMIVAGLGGFGFSVLFVGGMIMENLLYRGVIP